MRTGYSPRDVIHAISGALAVGSAACVAVLMLVTSADVARRSLEGRSVPGAVEVGELLIGCIVYLGMAYAQRRKEHVAINVVTARVPRRAGHVLRLLGHTVLCGLVAWMTVATGQAALHSFLVGEYRFGLLQMPIWPARLMIPLGLGVLFLELLVDGRDLVRALIDNAETHDG